MSKESPTAPLQHVEWKRMLTSLFATTIAFAPASWTCRALTTKSQLPRSTSAARPTKADAASAEMGEQASAGTANPIVS